MYKIGSRVICNGEKGTVVSIKEDSSIVYLENGNKKEVKIEELETLYHN
jgi:preprotein translocase subunit YajC